MFQQTKQKNDKFNFMWIEKYRPKTLNDVVLENHVKKQFDQYINQGEIPHLLFYGSPGSGKTTIARILVSHILKTDMDLLILNGSEQRGIDVVRNSIIEFLKYKSQSSNHKIIFIDEADYMTEQAFNAMRRVFEEFYENGRFILTCNYVHKIPSPIRSRCSEFKFKELPYDFVLNRCKNILENESIKYDEMLVKKIINLAYPDMRKIIGNLQKFSIDGVLQVDNEEDLMDLEDFVVLNTIDLFLKVYNRDITKANILINELIQKVNENDNIDFVHIFKKLFESDKVYAVLKPTINKYLNQLNQAVLPSMHYTAFIFECSEILKGLING